MRTPEVAKEYPFILNTGGRFMPQHHSEFRQSGIGMREKHPDPWMDINTADAQKLGIQEGEWVFIETRRGRIKQRARVTDRILPGVVNVEASGGSPRSPARNLPCTVLWESNANVLCLDEPDRLIHLPAAGKAGRCYAKSTRSSKVDWSLTYSFKLLLPNWGGRIWGNLLFPSSGRWFV